MMKIGTPLSPSATRVLLLGAGELGKELAIELMRMGVEVIACDRYNNAPAMQVAHRSYVLDMTDASRLREVVEREQPFAIVPEIEAVATKELLSLEKDGYRVVPSARAADIAMDRGRLRRLAAQLELPTARFYEVTCKDSLKVAAEKLGFPCVVKPLMSSSGKGQSIVYHREDLEKAWNYAMAAGRVVGGDVLVEEFVDFESELTLLTIRGQGAVRFCDPIGHRQEDGDYVESWQPHQLSTRQWDQVRDFAEKITEALGGDGLFGVEFFLTKDGGVLFNEVAPRPHDTGMVTMTTQFLSEFSLHARAILGLPLGDVERHSVGASVAIKSLGGPFNSPNFLGMDEICADQGVEVRLFGKPHALQGRRLGVVLARGTNVEDCLAKARESKHKLRIVDASV